MHTVRLGKGKPLLLVHGLGGSWRSWVPVLDDLSAQRQVIAVDLPGFGRTPPLGGEVSIRALADKLTDYIDEHRLTGVDAVGSSMGGRLVLELARRGGVLGAVVSLAPTGFWDGWERRYFHSSLYTSIRLIRLLQPLMPTMAGTPLGRAFLLSQFSSHPSRLWPIHMVQEMRTYAGAVSFDPLLRQLATGDDPEGAPVGSIARPLVIGWGRRDRLCFPRQAPRALALFPDARLEWFKNAGHFPHWDAPAEATRLILETTADGTVAPRTASPRSAASALRVAAAGGEAP